MDGSSSSSSTRRRMKPHLPLVKCPWCRFRTMKVYTSNTEDHPDMDFYKCPNHQVSDSGCDFWKREKSYKRYIESIGISARYETVEEGRNKTMMVEASVLGRRKPTTDAAPPVTSVKEAGEGHTINGKEDETKLKLIQAVDFLKDIRILLICIMLVEIIVAIKYMS